MAHQFLWYALVNYNMPLEQGDFLDNIPIIVPTTEITDSDIDRIGSEIHATRPVESYDVVVMTQSCDFIKLGDNDQVILCPRYDYLELINSPSGKKFGGPDGWKKLIDGRFNGAHIINKCKLDGFELDYQIIDLKLIFSVPLAIVKRIAGKQRQRLRLLPPYREHLAQAFARQFMRVGLPIDLPKEYPFAKP